MPRLGSRAFPFGGRTPGGGRLVAVLLAACAFGCAPAGGAHEGVRRPVRSLAELRHEGVVIQHWDLSCGAAALATLFTFDLGDPVAERAVAGAMLRRTDPPQVRVQGGFSLLDLQQYAEGRGYEAAGYGRLTLPDLVELAPAIVPVRLHGYDHFVVFRGVRDGEVVFADPAFGKRTLPIPVFERAWEQKVAFVVRRIDA